MALKITHIEGNSQRLDGGAMFGNAPRTLWQRWASPDDLGRIELATRGLLISDGITRVLCEAGIGSYMEPKLAERFGVQNYGQHCLVQSLAAQGLSPQDIDYIILSHLHFDHAGGLLPNYNKEASHPLEIIFPKAKIIVSRIALERALHPHPRDKASFIPGLAEVLQASQRLLIIEEGKAQLETLWPNHLSFLVSNGHTPGQLHSILRGERYQLVFCGDLVPGEHWVHIPISMGYDRNAELVGEEKQMLYDRLLRDAKFNGIEPLLFFVHDPIYPAGLLDVDEKGRYILKKKWQNLTSMVV